ncbi:MAG: PAS domain S-box protein [Deltaproteobacteria bacterium]|nr:PAS domain S-box protein [Deltaproteobacteria bacterium]
MIYLDLLFNLTLLISLSIVSGFIEKRCPAQTVWGQWWQALLFGAIAVIGMLKPLDLGQGLIFDGRSIMISLCALFFGPWAGGGAGIMAITTRLALGGIGTLMGVLVIASSYLLGLLAHVRMRPAVRPPSFAFLYIFGVVVHAAMVALMFTLPAGAGPAVIKRIGPAVLLLYPLATVLVGKLLVDQVSAGRTLAALQKANQQLAVTLQSIGDAVLSTNAAGEIVFMNPVAEALTGWSQQEALGKPVAEVLRLVDESTRNVLESPVVRALREESVVTLVPDSLLLARDGSERPVADSSSPIRDAWGNVSGVVLAFRDQSEERRNRRLTGFCLELLDYAATHSLDELLKEVPDKIGRLVNSPNVFCYLVEDDQITISRQAPQDLCRSEGQGRSCDPNTVASWRACVRLKKAVVRNDAEEPVGGRRELLVPVLHEGRVVALLGLRDKPTDYTDKDGETVTALADLAWQIVDKKRTEVERGRLLSAIEQAGEMIIITDAEGNIQYVNPAFERVTGYTRAEVVGKNPRLLKSDEHPPSFYRRLWHTVSGGAVFQERLVSRRKDGGIFTEAATISPVRDPTGQITSYVAVSRDITEQLSLEKQFQQAQKMESVGRLAGGVAHDFNNMLSVIIGYAELALDGLKPKAPLTAELHEILNAARRSAEIARQLLAFARKQTISPQVIDLNERVEHMLGMLRRLIGEDIDLAWLPQRPLWSIKIDPTQIEQVLVNLCVNARDAIAGVGKITIETRTRTFDEAYCAEHHGFVPGEFVLLAVSDDGCGMDKEILASIFEPFFTTKSASQGTGLGLSMVFGIVKQNEGFINVYSEPGEGASFRIYWPRHVGEVRNAVPEQTAWDMPLGRGERVLIVEDEPGIREMLQSLLERLQYRVLAAKTPGEALELARGHRDEISLLITDVVMPEMNGNELAGKMHELCPTLKIMFMSGYTANVIAHRGVLEDGVHFMQKPFSLQEMAAKVREVLEA